MAQQPPTLHELAQRFEPVDMPQITDLDTALRVINALCWQIEHLREDANRSHARLNSTLELCAKIADEYAPMYHNTAHHIAAAIRVMKESTPDA